MNIAQLISDLEKCPPDSIVAATTDPDDIKTIHSIIAVRDMPNFVMGGLVIIVADAD